MSVQSALELPQIDFQPQPYTGPSREGVMEMRQAHVSPVIFTLYREPLMIVQGHMQYLFDDQGRRYLDLFGGIVTVSCGHCHPKIVQRLEGQLRTLQHATSIYLHPNLPTLARRISDKLPEGLDVTYFVNSGSEADDLALLMARLFTGNTDVIALRNSYHGGAGSALSLTSHHTWKYPSVRAPYIHHAANPDPYRSPFRGTHEEIAEQSAEDIRNLIRYSTPGKVAAFIAEPIQGVGGVTLPARNYFKLAYDVVRKHGGLCIADEVQTGFGRTGDHFWGFENYDVVPDIVTMAKGFGNGAPLAAVTTRREIAEVLTQRIHFNTYGGNPVSMAAGLAVLDVIEEEGLQENARVNGAHFKKGLERLRDRHSIIGDVRGMGLMLGVELVLDRETKEPAKAEAAALLEELRERSVLIGKGGLDGNVLRIKPPMCINRGDIDYALDALDGALQAVAR